MKNKFDLFSHSWHLEKKNLSEAKNFFSKVSLVPVKVKLHKSIGKATYINKIMEGGELDTPKLRTVTIIFGK